MSAALAILLTFPAVDFDMLQGGHEARPEQKLAEPAAAAKECNCTAGGICRCPDGACACSALPRPGRPRPSERSRRILFYTADWCGPCRTFKEVVVPQLAANGWTVGHEPTNHVQAVDVGNSLPRGIDALPTFVLIENGRELERRVGLLDQRGIAELYRGHRVLPQPRGVRRTDLPARITRVPSQSRAAVQRQLVRPCPYCGGFH